MPSNCRICGKSAAGYDYGDLTLINSFGKIETSSVVLRIDSICHSCSEEISSRLMETVDTIAETIKAYCIPRTYSDKPPLADRTRITKYVQEKLKYMCISVVVPPLMALAEKYLRKDLRVGSAITDESLWDLSPSQIFESVNASLRGRSRIV